MDGFMFWINPNLTPEAEMDESVGINRPFLFSGKDMDEYDAGIHPNHQ